MSVFAYLVVQFSTMLAATSQLFLHFLVQLPIQTVSKVLVTSNLSKLLSPLAAENTFVLDYPSRTN